MYIGLTKQDKIGFLLEWKPTGKINLGYYAIKPLSKNGLKI